MDYETTNQHTITLSVSDGAFSNTALVTIEVTNVNESPLFDMPSYVFTNGEDIGDEVIIGTVTATDLDRDALTFSILSNDRNNNGLFEIGTNNGEISLALGQSLNYETTNQHTITLAVSDGLLSNTALVTIEVTNVNEAPPLFDLTNYVFTNGEDIGDEMVIGTVTATDLDRDALTFSILSNDNSLFEVGANSGEISLAPGQALDYETTNRHTITVSVSDGAFSNTALVTIEVTNVNDAPLFDMPSYVFTNGEDIGDEVIIGTVTATDMDGDVLTFSILTNDYNNVSFEIGTNNGEISLALGQSLNYETTNRHTITVSVSDGIYSNTALVTIEVIDVPEVDADGDGLIEIYNLTMLHNMRYDLDGTSYKTNGSDPGDNSGCPDSGCFGYELVSNLSFDADGDGSTWSGNHSNGYTLDSGDSAEPYFDTDDGGWEPIGDNTNPFSAIFEGNGFTITGLAVNRGSSDRVGMFGNNYSGHIRNLGLVNNLAHGDDYVGGLVGWQEGGSITASYASGNVSGNRYVGGLVGRQQGGSITASYASGYVSGNNNYVGGLVGWQEGGSITASYASGYVSGSSRVGGLVGLQNGGSITASGGSITASYASGNVSGNNNYVGGLVGYQYGGSITASYASGYVSGDRDVGGLVGAQIIANSSITASYASGYVSGDRDVGGLVGEQDGGSITASYASGNVSSVSGDRDVGGLVGDQDGGSITASYASGNVSGNNDVGGLVGYQRGSITASYGFGAGGVDGDPPVANASLLTLANAGPVWNDSSAGTLGVWQFDSPIPPRLRYHDYDGSGGTYGCGSGTGLVFTNCGDLIPEQYQAPITTNQTFVVEESISDTAIIGPVWAIDIQGEALFFSILSNDNSLFEVGANSGEISLAPGQALDYETTNQHTITVSVSDGVFSNTALVTIEETNVNEEVDADGDGLIEIHDLTMLHNMRYDLDGSHYRSSSGDAGNNFGCPDSGCFGYELVSNLSFDADGDGSTWSGNVDDGYTLDSGDSAAPYFVTASGGWDPINSFTATFEGNGFTITGLAVNRGSSGVGMFGNNYSGHIRNLGLVNNLAHGDDDVGGLVGWQEGGSITASYASGNVSGDDDVGGLVGYQAGGNITASYASGNVSGDDDVGGLVGRQDGGSITASYASGNVSGDRDVGGLVGEQDGGSITASYASGNVSGDRDVGGLVAGKVVVVVVASPPVMPAAMSVVIFMSEAWWAGKVVASPPVMPAAMSVGITESEAWWAIKEVASPPVMPAAMPVVIIDVGGLVGEQQSGSITASYGFGAGGIDGNPPVIDASLLTLANAGAVWDEDASNTAGAWQFGSGTPKLLYHDYDGSGGTYGCGSGTNIVFTNCGDLIPQQSNSTTGFAISSRPQGITYYDNSLWVVDNLSDKVYRHSTIGVSLSNFDLSSYNGGASGITYYNNNFWVVDKDDNKFYRYTTNWEYFSANNFALTSDNNDAEGFTSYDNALWVVDSGDDKVYKYSTEGSYQSSGDFSLTSNNSEPRGITYGDNAFWVVDREDERVYKYSTNGNYNSSGSFDLPSYFGIPDGITYYDGGLWVVDRDNDRVYRYPVVD